MGAAGLDRVERLAGAGGAARGALPGEEGLCVLLFVGCGATGDEAAAGATAALAAVDDLARTPRRHTLEVVLCAPTDESTPGRVSSESVSPDRALPASGRAARAWLSLHPEAAVRGRVLAALDLEGVAAGGPSTALPAAGSGPGGLRLTPAWLVHAALTGARASGAGLAYGGHPEAVIGRPLGPLLGQLVARFARPRVSSGAATLLADGVPALTLAGEGPGDWPLVLAAVVRRLDGLAGRPRDDDACLAVGGRVWSRRDLYWVGLAVWVALLATGLPGRWRGAGGEQRRRRGRRYLPGFALRMLFLLLLLLTPAATLVLVAPAALLTLAPLHRRVVLRLGRLLAVAPAAAFAGYWLAEVIAGRVAAWPAEPLRLALVLIGVVLAVCQIGRPRREAVVAANGTGGR